MKVFLVEVQLSNKSYEVHYLIIVHISLKLTVSRH